MCLQDARVVSWLYTCGLACLLELHFIFKKQNSHLLQGVFYDGRNDQNVTQVTTSVEMSKWSDSNVQNQMRKFQNLVKKWDFEAMG